MSPARSVGWTVVLFAVALTAQASAGVCQEAATLAAMSTARSLKDLDAAVPTRPTSYRLRFVHALRAFELQPSSASRADALLAVMPGTEGEYGQLLVMADVCQSEPISDHDVLSRVPDSAASALAKAIILRPSAMPRYLDYVALVSSDPHSRAALEMRNVCLRHHGPWLAAVAARPNKWRSWFDANIMRTTDCKVVALPEAE